MRAFAGFLFSIALFAAGPARAHAMLEHATPAAGAVLHSVPKSVELSFSESLEPAFSAIAVSDAQNHDVTAGKTVASGTTMSVTLKGLKAGAYKVRWRALSVDTHRTQGSFTFTVAP